MAKTKRAWTRFLKIFFFAYCIILLYLLFGRTYGWVDGLTYPQMLEQNVNLLPFLTIRNYLRVIFQGTNRALFTHCVVNLSGNILLFMPIGYLLPRIWQKQHNFFRFFFTCAGAIVLVETLQLFTLLGSFDVDDIILNLLGMLLGFLFFHLKNLWKKR